ncbi:MAG: TonB-dependent receptor plug domain-containing protein [Spirochaetales bacterium]|nr:TonB-dependent receptor plug domain-containing protein [Spirochaetales bacterium]
MKIRTLFFTLFSLTAFLLTAGELNLSIIDRDLDFPLEGAMVALAGEETIYYADSTGSLTLPLPDNARRLVLLVSYPGYESVRLPLAEAESSLEIAMVLAGIIEGEELVVERTAPGEKEEESGISVVMNQEEMETTANIGMVEDVMSTIKTLPGVIYTGGWDAQPSIRGGYPEEMAAALDGFYVTYPYHWGGAYSIFNPNMTESAKLSHGIYSARYGRALSGILEVTTKTPDEPELRIDGSLSTTSTDLFLQTPLGKKSGLFLGGKVTYLETLKLIFPEDMEDMTTVPYIRDLYGKWQYSPGDKADFYLNGFLGTDGVGVETTTSDEDEDFTSEVLFDYDYIDAFLAGGMEWSPTDFLFIDVLAGVNWNFMDMIFELSDSGESAYSEEFIDRYGALYGLTDGDTYSLDGLDSEGEDHTDLRQGQIKITAEKLLKNDDVLVFGTEQVIKRTSQEGDYSLYVTVEEEDGSFSLEKMNFSTDVDGNYSWNPAAFFIWEKGDDQSPVESELGLRAEHYRIWNDEFSMDMVPAVNPHATVTFNTEKHWLGADDLSFTMGSGLFSYFSLTTEFLEKDYGIDDWEVTPDQALFSIVGTEMLWDKGWKFTAETYYKYYLNRLVLTSDDLDGDDESELYYNNDGKGHVVGFDMMIQKKNGGKWDGYLSYSLIYARYYNPSNTGTSDEDSAVSYGEPLDQWYFPYYHRYHSLNLVGNWHFSPGWTFSVMGSLATGAPRDEVGDITVYPADLDGTIIEQYARSSYYSDSLRDGISVPVDLRISYGRYGHNKKIYTEWYFAIEDIFVNLYEPSTNTSFNSNTGEEDQDTSADFSLGVPVPSFGFKVSY